MAGSLLFSYTAHTVQRQQLYTAGFGEQFPQSIENLGLSSLNPGRQTQLLGERYLLKCFIEKIDHITMSSSSMFLSKKIIETGKPL